MSGLEQKTLLFSAERELRFKKNSKVRSTHPGWPDYLGTVIRVHPHSLYPYSVSLDRITSGPIAFQDKYLEPA